MSKKILPVLAILLLTGCWDKVELENRGFVVSLGVDKNENKYAVSMAVPNVAALAEKSGSDKANSVKTADNETIAGAMSMADSASSQTMYYGQTKMTVLGKDVLTDERLFREALDAMERNREINRKMIILSTQGEAKDILEAEIPGEPMVGMYIANYYKSNANRTGITFRQDLEKILLDLRATDCTVIPQIEKNDDEINLSGMAVMKDFKLAGFLDEKETRGYLWLNGGCKDAMIIAPYEDGYIPLRIAQNRSKLRFYDDEGLVCHAIVNVEGNIAEYTFTGQSFDDKTLQSLGDLFAEIIENEISATVRRMQEDFAADGYLFKEKLRKKNYPLFLQVIEDWENAYANMKIIPEAHVKITGAGAIR